MCQMLVYRPPTYMNAWCTIHLDFQGLAMMMQYEQHRTGQYVLLILVLLMFPYLQAKFTLSVTSVYAIRIYVYNTDQVCIKMFFIKILSPQKPSILIFQFLIPNKKKIFGSDYTEMNLFNFNYGESLFQEFEISVKSHWKTLDHPSQRCLKQDIEHVKIKDCIVKYIKDTVGCYGLHCYDDLEKLSQFVNITKALQNMGGNDIFELTGCLAACDQSEFEIRELGPLKYESSRHKDVLNGTVKIATPYEMKLNFYFPRGEWEEKEQVSNSICTFTNQIKT